jgi:ribosomal protein L19
MQLFTSMLIKTKYKLFNASKKRPNLEQSHKRLTGKVLRVMFNKRTTKFEVSDFVKTSKKQRSNVVDVQVKDIFQYNFIGICIAQKRDEFVLNSSFLIRNTFDQFPYELCVPLYSPMVDAISVLNYIDKLLYYTHSKYYYLRKKPMPLSTIYFDYVIDMYAHDIDDTKDSSVFKDVI